MADALDTKLIYKRGTCFSCRKCLYCGVDLQTQKCKCDITKLPHRVNRTEAVKYVYTRIFTPNWTADQPDLYDLTLDDESFQNLLNFFESKDDSEEDIHDTKE
ncbi:1863_t:CDS:2, partial [Racocetra persica]